MTLSGGAAHRLTLDDLAALNREMAALVRAGLPLESGLEDAAKEFSRGTSRLAATLAEQTATGRSLPEALAELEGMLPPVYRAVVDAGLRSGRLAAALEGFAETAARIGELRRIAAQAAIYPLLVLSVAWMMTIFVLSAVIPRYGWLEIEEQIWVTPLELPQPWLWALALGMPAFGLALVIAWWRRTGKARALGGGRGLLRWIPGVRRAIVLSNYANFADLLQLLIGCRVPLEEALPLAARASDHQFVAPAERIASQIGAGQSLGSNLAELRRFPPLVRIALAAGVSERTMLNSLRGAARTYRERAAGWITELAVTLPVVLTLVIGAGIVLVYAGLLLQPYFALLEELLRWSA